MGITELLVSAIILSLPVSLFAECERYADVQGYLKRMKEQCRGFYRGLALWVGLFVWWKRDVAGVVERGGVF